jgi:hypothetical protein
MLDARHLASGALWLLACSSAAPPPSPASPTPSAGLHPLTRDQTQRLVDGGVLYWRHGEICEPWQIHVDPDDPARGRLARPEGASVFSYTFTIRDGYFTLSAPHHEADDRATSLPCTYDGLIERRRGAPQITLHAYERWYTELAACERGDPPRSSPARLRLRPRRSPHQGPSHRPRRPTPRRWRPVLPPPKRPRPRRLLAAQRPDRPAMRALAEQPPAPRAPRRRPTPPPDRRSPRHPRVRRRRRLAHPRRPPPGPPLMTRRGSAPAPASTAARSPAPPPTTFFSQEGAWYLDARACERAREGAGPLAAPPCLELSAPDGSGTARSPAPPA